MDLVNPIYLFIVAIWRLDLITNTSACSDTLVQVEHEALKPGKIDKRCFSFVHFLITLTHRQHVVALLVDFFLFLGDVELPEEVERDHCVDVDDDGEEHDREHELLAVVSDGLEDDAESSDAHGNVDEVRREEEVVVIAEDREDEVPKQVQEWLEI